MEACSDDKAAITRMLDRISQELRYLSVTLPAISVAGKMLRTLPAYLNDALQSLAHLVAHGADKRLKVLTVRIHGLVLEGNRTLVAVAGDVKDAGTALHEARLELAEGGQP